MVQWSIVHRVFAYRLHFSVRGRGAALNGKTIMRWVDSFQTGTVNKKNQMVLNVGTTETTSENTES